MIEADAQTKIFSLKQYGSLILVLHKTNKHKENDQK